MKPRLRSRPRPQDAVPPPRALPIVRSALGAFLLAAVVVTLPMVAEEVVSDLFLEASVLERFSVKILADVALAVFVTSAIGMLEVTMAHSLIAHDRMAPPEAGAAKKGDAATTVTRGKGAEPAGV